MTMLVVAMRMDSTDQQPQMFPEVQVQLDLTNPVQLESRVQTRLDATTTKTTTTHHWMGNPDDDHRMGNPDQPQR